jgi:purine-binding chemotaxis protein CheW
MAIAIEDLAEVGPLPAVTFLPNLPAWIQGIVNIRSEVISVIDLPVFLGLAQKRGSGGRFVVLRHRKLKVGVRLDSIAGTVGRFASDIKPIDAFDGSRLDTSLFHSGLLVEKQFYLILNVRKLLTAPRLVDYNRAG